MKTDQTSTQPQEVESLTPQRQRLPDTRHSITHKYRVGGHEGYLTVGVFDDGRPGELFIRMAKEGSTIGGLMDTIGVLTSLALQYGVPLDTLARKFQHTRFEPNGETDDPDVGKASSVVDYIFRRMALWFREDPRGRVPATEEPSNK